MGNLGYCPNCKRNVLKKREDFSYLLAFILAFTGIGLIIYVLYYVDQKPKYCFNCDTLCEPFRLVNQSEQIQKIEPLIQKQITDKKIRFCHNCGSELGHKEDIKFCHLCGIKID